MHKGIVNGSTVTIELSKSKTIVLARDTSNLYNFIQKNDSIVKGDGTDILMVYRLNIIHRFKSITDTQIRNKAHKWS